MRFRVWSWALVLLALAVFDVRLRTIVANSDRELNALRANLASLSQRESQTKNRLSNTNQRIDEIRAELERRKRHPNSRSVAAEKRPNSNPSLFPLSLIVNNPDLMASYLAAAKSRTGRNYGALFKSLGLTPEQIAAFEGNLLGFEKRELEIASVVPDLRRSLLYSNDAALTNVSVSIASGQQSADPDVQAALELVQEARRAMDDAQAALLGLSGFQYLQQFERCLPVRPLVDEVVTEAAVTTEPLTFDQANTLATILAESSKHYADGGTAASYDINWDAAISRAQAVLSASQIEALQTISAPEIWRRRMVPFIEADGARR